MNKKTLRSIVNMDFHISKKIEFSKKRVKNFWYIDFFTLSLENIEKHYVKQKNKLRHLSSALKVLKNKFDFSIWVWCGAHLKLEVVFWNHFAHTTSKIIGLGKFGYLPCN
jgi:hypothetical protein